MITNKMSLFLEYYYIAKLLQQLLGSAYVTIFVRPDVQRTVY